MAENFERYFQTIVKEGLNESEKNEESITLLTTIQEEILKNDPDYKILVLVNNRVDNFIQQFNVYLNVLEKIISKLNEFLQSLREIESRIKYKNWKTTIEKKYVKLILKLIKPVKDKINYIQFIIEEFGKFDYKYNTFKIIFDEITSYEKIEMLYIKGIVMVQDEINLHFATYNATIDDNNEITYPTMDSSMLTTIINISKQAHENLFKSINVISEFKRLKIEMENALTYVNRLENKIKENEELRLKNIKNNQNTNRLSRMIWNIIKTPEYKNVKLVLFYINHLQYKITEELHKIHTKLSTLIIVE